MQSPLTTSALLLSFLLIGALGAGCNDASAPPSGVGNNGSNANNTGANSTPNNGANCIDQDGDGFGIGCAKGADCADSDPTIQACDCAQGNFPGCPCSDEGATESCFSGTPAQLGVGNCQAGVRTCGGGAWGTCIGEFAPNPEICDNRDNDCDGSSDEGIQLNACGTCDPLCDGQGVGPRSGDGTGGASGWGLNEDNSDGVVANEDEGLELSTADLNFNFLYTANSEEGTISKLDTRTGREIARYVSALPGEGRPNPLARCNPNDNNPPGNCPSRTAVDLQGDVWVANRTFIGQASVTKVANKDCLDRNGDGVITTSHDANGNGVIDLNDPVEFPGAADECILFTVNLGGSGNDRAILRALAVDPFTPDRGYGSVWVGAFNLRKYFQLSGRDGSIIREVDVAHQPYGAVMDRFGVLWSTDTSATTNSPALIRIISETGQVDGNPIPIRGQGCNGSYGITIDGADNIWMGGWTCESAIRYNHPTQSWLTVAFPSGTGVGRGIAADRDGWVYVGSSYTPSGDARAYITRFRQEDGSQLQRYDARPDGLGTIGVGLDYQGKVWGVNQGSGNATRLDPATGTIEVFPVGAGPYTYSDFTGYQLRAFTAPQGTYRRVFAACPQKSYATWEKVVWESDTPPGTAVAIRVKSVFSLDDLPTAPQYGPFDESPALLGPASVPDGKFLEVEITLTSDTPGITPVLWGLDVVWTCPPAG